MATGAEPLLLAVAPKIAGAAFGLVLKEAGRHLAPDEAKRLRRALAEAIVIPSERPDSKRAKGRKVLNRASRGKFYATPKEKEKVLTDLEKEFGASKLTELAGPGDDGLTSWREKLELRLAAAAKEGKGKDPKSWNFVLADETPQEWAERVAGTFETKLRTDPELRFLLARLDWGDVQATRVVMAEAARSIRLALWRIAFVLTAVATGITIGADELMAIG